MRKGQEHSEERGWRSFVDVQGSCQVWVISGNKQNNQTKAPLRCKSLKGGDSGWHGLGKVSEDIQMFLILPSNDTVGVQPDAVTPEQITFCIFPLYLLPTYFSLFISSCLRNHFSLSILVLVWRPVCSAVPRHEIQRCFKPVLNIIQCLIPE